MTLAELNTLPPPARAAELTRCCGAQRWATALNQVDRYQQAHELAGRYLWALVQTFESGVPATDSVAYEQRFADGGRKDGSPSIPPFVSMTPA